MPIDAELFRKVMGNFATGVTVVTTAVDGRFHGFTANSVTSVSLEPLLLLVCVDKRAQADRELQSARCFGVNLLSTDQIDVSKSFARSGPPCEGGLRGVPFRIGETGVPLIEGCLASLECQIQDRVEAGDHTIVIGRAVAGALDRDEPPLIFFRGSYRRLAD